MTATKIHLSVAASLPDASVNHPALETATMPLHRRSPPPNRPAGPEGGLRIRTPLLSEASRGGASLDAISCCPVSTPAAFWSWRISGTWADCVRSLLTLPLAATPWLSGSLRATRCRNHCPDNSAAATISPRSSLSPGSIPFACRANSSKLLAPEADRQQRCSKRRENTRLT